MRYLGIDYGEKNIGLAISDEDGQLAFPQKVIENSPNLVNEILSICNKNGIRGIVIGDSKNFKMEDNPIMKEIKDFSAQIAKNTAIPIFFHPEFMTTQQATFFQGENNLSDASAAALILQSFLDSNR